MSPLADRLKQRQAEYGKQLAAATRSDLICYLKLALSQALLPITPHARDVTFIKRLLIEDAASCEHLSFDPQALHQAIAQCLCDGVELPAAFTLILAQGVAEPQSLRRKKGKTHEALHHEIWRLCRLLAEYRSVPIYVNESKRHGSAPNTACGLLAEAARDIRTTSRLSEDHIRQIYYDRRKLYGEI